MILQAIALISLLILIMFCGLLSYKFNRDGSDFAAGIMGLVFLFGLWIFAMICLIVISGNTTTQIF